MGKNKGTKALMNKKIEEDFGYILITKDFDKKNIEKYSVTNSKQLRFTNKGKFDLRVDFVFLSTLNYEPVQKPEPTPFLLVENFLEIKKDETKLLQVYCFPQKQEEVRDEVVCLIADNPIPIRIGLICKGSEPKVTVEPENLTLDFEKSIINQQLTRTLKLKNESQVNC